MSHKHKWQLAKYEPGLWSKGMGPMESGHFATFVCECGKEKIIQVKQ